MISRPTWTENDRAISILLEPYEDHVLLGPIQNSIQVNTWGEFFDELFRTGTYEMLSSGERATADLAMAIYNGHPRATVSSLAFLDQPHRERALEAITIWLSQ